MKASKLIFFIIYVAPWLTFVYKFRPKLIYEIDSGSGQPHALVSRSGEEEADPRVFLFMPSVWNFITDPNSSAFFLLLVSFQVPILPKVTFF
jgi:hypothetical protein